MKKLSEKFLNLLITLTLIISLTGCYQLTKIIHKGTAKGVILCIEHNSSSILSEELVKRKCIKENQTEIVSRSMNEKKDLEAMSYMKSLGIKGSIWLDNKSAKIFLNEGTNSDYDYILTELKVRLIIKDENGKRYLRDDTIDIWVEPSKQIEGRIAISFSKSVNRAEINNKYCGDSTIKTCKSWGVISVLGIKI